MTIRNNNKKIETNSIRWASELKNFDKEQVKPPFLTVSFSFVVLAIGSILLFSFVDSMTKSTKFIIIHQKINPNLIQHST